MNTTVAPRPDSAVPAGVLRSPIGEGLSAGEVVDGLLTRFEAATLGHLEAVALLDRTDRKYLLTAPQLRPVLASLADDYLVLEIDRVRRHRYRTLYFDTPAFELFRRHHAAAARRHKVRSRTYVDTGLSFFEVKGKDARGRTVKHRLRTDALVTRLGPPEVAFVAAHAPVPPDALEPKLWNAFERITLVGRRRPERLTIDLGLTFETDAGHATGLPGIVVAELKQQEVDHASPFARRMRSARIRPESVSKYCVGVALLHGDVRHNAFKPTLRTVARLMEEAARVW